MPVEEDVSDVAAEVVGCRVALLIGDEEDDEDEKEIHDDLLQHGFHLNLFHPLLALLRQKRGVRRCIVAVGHIPLHLNVWRWTKGER